MVTEQIVAPGFEALAAKARKQLRAAGGGALCVYHHGQPVLDVWAGKRDPKAGVAWESDSMAMAWSTTKGIASTAVHMLAERGLLNYDAPVAAYWPEFAANGKANITVRQLLSMEAGLYDVRNLIDEPRLMLHHNAMATALAAAAPAHQPGKANGYHAITYGWLLGELVQRLTGDSLGAFVQAEIAGPLALDGCYIGTPKTEIPRVAVRPHLPPESAIVRSVAKLANPVMSLFGVSPARIAAAFAPRRGYEVIPTAEFLEAEVASMNGVFTARSLARIYSALANDDGLDGVRLWTPQTRRLATARQNNRRDRVLSVRVGWQLGYHRTFPKWRTPSSTFGFYGAFGSGAFGDPVNNVGVGFVVQQAKGTPLLNLAPAIFSAVKR
jgi:CubicO group peptidase (beta-lactamase class C family)